MNDRQLPHDLEAEQDLLGAFLLDPEECFDSVGYIVRAQDFYSEKNRIVFSHIVSVRESGLDVDLVTVCAALRTSGNLDRVGSAAYLMGLMNTTGTAAYVTSYARIVQEKALLRLAIESMLHVTSMCYSGSGPKEVLQRVEKAFFDIGKRSGSFNDSWASSDQIHDRVSAKLEELSTASGISGLASGFPSLDKMTTGFQNGSLNIVAARSSMGKTAFATSIAINCAAYGKKVALFSLEMATEEIGIRILSGLSRVDMQKIRSGSSFDVDEKGRLEEALGKISNSGISIDDDSGLDISELNARATKLSVQSGLDLLVVDYLQLIDGPTKGTREQEVSYVVRSIKKLARKLEVPVILLSQLSRAVENRGNNRPILSDLRESGAIEQDADLVMFLYRDDYYNPNSDDAGNVEIIIGKQRNGPVGTIKLGFVKSQTRFIDDMNNYKVITK